MSEPGEAPVPYRFRAAGLLLGPLLFGAVLLTPRPADLSPEAQRVAAVAVLMGVWWVTEAIPIAAASLAPLIAFPLLNVMKAGDTAVCYGDSTIFLFAGGFFIAMAMQQWRLHERIALHIIRVTGTNPRRLVLGFMLASASISLWISNAATTMMMIPIALAVIQQFEKEHNAAWVAPFGTAVMLGIAYASSIGGVGTIVGTAPNVIFLGQMAKLFPEAPRITFTQWLFFGIPLVSIFVPLAWWIMARWMYRLPGGKGDDAEGGALIAERLRALGAPNRGEKIVASVFVLTALGWVFRQDIPLGSVTIPGWARVLPDPKFVDDGTVAIAGAMALFVLPVDIRKGRFALEWEWAKRIPWGILLLFGGGIAIAKGFDDTGLVDWVGDKLAFVKATHPIVMTFLICAAVIALTEFMSNTALTMLMIPVLAAASTRVFECHPLFVLLPAVLSASLGFMMPAGTPPNALVFGSGYVTIPQMMRAGFILNVIAAVLVTLLAYFVIVPVFQITIGEVPDWAR
ncbi:MAG: DASS family sodium-coupled anion symporter [Candidatus Hydrogenedentes bacterium]|nr:DASS family sodium-coupled anion symporter [Candidatus Hydrogenedentota bacterium]